MPAFKNNIRPILLLPVGLVLFTAFVVGFVLHLLLPQLPFAICLALGATLPLVARRLKLAQDDPVQDALSAAGVQQQASRAAQDRLDELAESAPAAAVDRLRRAVPEEVLVRAYRDLDLEESLLREVEK
ncbi:hypothetical protein OG811_20960 [Micromonospora sp. NBC_01638]|nr:hypothetical protein OG811_20960 [Micromonospora sp. NBC_01638]